MIISISILAILYLIFGILNVIIMNKTKDNYNDYCKKIGRIVYTQRVPRYIIRYAFFTSFFKTHEVVGEYQKMKTICNEQSS